jgi:hypothetical protein
MTDCNIYRRRRVLARIAISRELRPAWRLMCALQRVLRSVRGVRGWGSDVKRYS